MRPWLLLDIDGVLNAQADAHSEYHEISIPSTQLPRSPFVNRPRGTQPLDILIRLNPDHRTWLAELSVHFDLVWASTWEDMANTYISPLVGLPALPFVDLSDEPVFYREVNRGQPAGWKWRAIERFIGLRPVAYVDAGGAALVGGRDLRNPIPTIVLCPEDGLGRHDVDALLAFAREVTPLPTPVLANRLGAAGDFVRLWRNALVRECAFVGVTDVEVVVSGREVYPDEECLVELLVAPPPKHAQSILAELSADLSDLLRCPVTLTNRAKSGPEVAARWRDEGDPL